MQNKLARRNYHHRNPRMPAKPPETHALLSSRIVAGGVGTLPGVKMPHRVASGEHSAAGKLRPARMAFGVAAKRIKNVCIKANRRQRRWRPNRAARGASLMPGIRQRRGRLAAVAGERAIENIEKYIAHAAIIMAF